MVFSNWITLADHYDQQFLKITAETRVGVSFDETKTSKSKWGVNGV